MPLTAKAMLRLLMKNGRIIILPMHSKDLSKGLEQQILKDAGLKNR